MLFIDLFPNLSFRSNITSRNSSFYYIERKLALYIEYKFVCMFHACALSYFYMTPFEIQSDIFAERKTVEGKRYNINKYKC